MYFEYFEDGRNVQKYCGREGSVRAKRKALELEIGLMERRMDEDRAKLDRLKRELGRLSKE